VARDKERRLMRDLGGKAKKAHSMHCSHARPFQGYIIPFARLYVFRREYMTWQTQSLRSGTRHAADI